jgi:hypothetical protein
MTNPMAKKRKLRTRDQVIAEFETAYDELMTVGAYEDLSDGEFMRYRLQILTTLLQASEDDLEEQLAKLVERLDEFESKAATSSVTPIGSRKAR